MATMPTPGGTTPDFDDLARFAVDEYNGQRRQPVLKYEKVICAKRGNVFAGSTYYIILEASKPDSMSKPVPNAMCAGTVWITTLTPDNPKMLLDFEIYEYNLTKKAM
ncbi:uncharacterized protein LOC111412860 [Olea europaea var. sylvestris]|uniref:uncharacterized protein LOC111378397 n=1 Tax=Olea europaea var. sylvestris TaxID=158386 RepID=UPI000C1D5759|nr:uncharacterized protein LOC111378397 [Olea europaea var. sylvestris]XP_022899505.1 uncharacterized protein LOC111412860 [Olea europaea var. sylvestris]